MRFGGRRKHDFRRLDSAKLSEPTVLTAYQNALASKLPCNPPDCVDQHLSLLQSAMWTASSDTCGLAPRTAKHWISSGSLQLLDACRLIPADSKYNGARVSHTRELRASLWKDREAWWSEHASEMEVAAATGNTRKLFQLIRATGTKKSGVGKIIYESDGTPVSSIEIRTERWAEHFKGQFNWPSGSVDSACSTETVPWSISIDSPTKAEIRKEIQVLKHHKASGSDDFHSAFFKDGGDALVRELTILFLSVWSSEQVPSALVECVITPFYLKGLRNARDNYRGISLIPVVSKLLASVILRKLIKMREERTREEQAGFHPSRGCIDQMFTLSQLLEQRRIYRRPTVVVFWTSVRPSTLSIEPHFGNVCIGLEYPRSIYRFLEQYTR